MPNPDRRLAPRPFPAHLASATALWLSSYAALPILKNVSRPSSEVGKRLLSLAGEIDAFGPDRVAAALDSEVRHRADAFLAGIEAYRRHPFRRREIKAPVLWREGSTRLLDYGGNATGPAVLLVPSLINRFYVLDILPRHSLVRHLAGQGLRPIVIDWGAPGSEERDFSLTDYIANRLDTAFTVAARLAGAPMAILGYCMGGLLALALALRRQPQVRCLALLATPWDFHSESAERGRLLARAADRLLPLWESHGTVPVELIQALFFSLDPFSAERKFVRFAGLDPEGAEARSFVALEDWLNDGVPLAHGVARECVRAWYGDNDPGRGEWRVAGQRVDPKFLRVPALVVVPSRDRIVPPSSAKPLAAELADLTVMHPPLGHVGMMAAARAPDMLWKPIGEWLLERL
jgi:polyhydroxyalkanoate synthase subunit PhaC